jgi:hypothetical protein
MGLKDFQKLTTGFAPKVCGHMVAMAILHKLILEGPVTMAEPYRTLECIFVIVLFASSGCVAVRHTK